MTTGSGGGTRDAADVEELVRRFRPLADQLTSIMAARVPRSVERGDLHSAALLGLFHAARTWDAARGVTFETFARHRIRGALLDELRERDWASRRLRTFARAVTRCVDALTADLGRRPTDAEIASRLDVPVAAVERLERDAHRAGLQTEDPFGDDSGPADPAADGPEETLERRERDGYLHDAVALLPERLRRVVLGYYVEELPMVALADELGVTESRISQMRAEAVRLLRAALSGALEPDRVGALALGSRAGERALGMAAELAASRSDARERLGLRLAG